MQELDFFLAFQKLMDSYFYKLGDKQGSVPSRIRFMIKDLLEQRKVTSSLHSCIRRELYG